MKRFQLLRFQHFNIRKQKSTLCEATIDEYFILKNTFWNKHPQDNSPRVMHLVYKIQTKAQTLTPHLEMELQFSSHHNATVFSDFLTQ